MSDRVSELGELAFEDGMVGVSPPRLFRVYSIRHWNGRQIRHVNWFCTRELAENHAAWIKDGRGEVVGVYEYRLVPETSDV